MLTKGQTFVLNGTRFKVAHVSSCRAHCRAMKVTTVTVTDKHGRSRSFEAHSTQTVDISPDTPLDVLDDLASGRF